MFLNFELSQAQRSHKKQFPGAGDLVLFSYTLQFILLHTVLSTDN